jgi:hypothetical protein
MLKFSLLAMMLSSIFACENSNLTGATAVGAEQTIQNQQESDKKDGNERSTKIEKESLINGAIAFVYCLISTEDKCE